MFHRNPSSQPVEMKAVDQSPAAQVKQWYLSMKITMIADKCVTLLEDEKSEGVANILNQLSSDEQKQLLAKWREEGQRDKQRLLLAAYFTPLVDLMKDKKFLEQVKEELDQKGWYAHNVYSSDNLLALEVNTRIALAENTNVNNSLLCRCQHLNLEGLDTVEMRSKKRSGQHDLRFPNMDFSNVNLQNAHCCISAESVNLTNAFFTNSKLIGSSLQGATLVGVNAKKTDLSKANLKNANCTAADFSGASLSGATLIEANLENANLKEADLRGVKWNSDPKKMIKQIKGANLLGAKMDNKAKNFIRRAFENESSENEFQPLFNYFKTWKATHSSLRSFFQGTPPFEKHLAALYLMGATTQVEFDKRYSEIPEGIKTSKYENSFAKAANAVRSNLPESPAIRPVLQ